MINLHIKSYMTIIKIS